MKKIFFILTILTFTLSLFSFKSIETGEQKLVYLKNYKINKENLKNAYTAYSSDVVTNSRVGCKYYCWVKAVTAITNVITEFIGNKTANGQEMTMAESDAIELEKMQILQKI